MGSVRLDRVPPQNIDAERAVLGAMMMNDPAYSQIAIADCIRVLNREDCFYREANRKIFEAIKFLFADDKPVDLLTVSQQLEESGDLEKTGGVPALNEMIESCPSAANAEHYAQMVKDESDRRVLIYTSAETYNEAFEPKTPVKEILSNAMERLLKVQLDVTEPPRSMKQVLKELFKDMQERSQNPNQIVGVPCGIRDIDIKIGGFLGGDVIVVAARPGVGKSTFVQNIAQYVCDHQDHRSHVLLFSMEMKDRQILARILSSESRISFERFKSSDFGDKDWPKLTIAAGKMTGWNLHIVDTPALNTLDIRSEILRRTGEKGPVDLVILDYLQLMSPIKSSGKREEDVGQISRELKKLAMSLDIPFLVVSQLNRNPENRPDKRPQLNDLRESGSIEQDADIVCFIYRDDYHDRTLDVGPCEFIIAKQRMGPTGTVKLHFNMEQARFMQAHQGKTGRQTFREHR